MNHSLMQTTAASAHIALPSYQNPQPRRRGFAVYFQSESEKRSGMRSVQNDGFQHLVHASADAMIVIRTDGTVAYANPAAARLFNRDAESMQDEPFGLPLTNNDGSTRVDILPRGGAPAVAEMRVVETRWYGQPAKLASLRDVTERVAMERSLSLSAVIFNHAAEGIALVDCQMRLVEVNAAFARFFDSPAGDLTGQPLVSAFNESGDLAQLITALRALEPGERWRGELKLAGHGAKSDRFVLVSVVQVTEEEDFPAHYVLLSTDITGQKQAQSQLHYEASHDGLTGLYNRVAFLDQLRAALARAKRKHRPLAVMFVDLDGFKVINDQHGHERGDRLLEAVAARMRAVVRTGDTVARMGGDEFTVLLEDITGPEDVITVAEKLRATITQPVMAGDTILQVQTSIGASLYPDNADQATALLDCADQALYRVKEHNPGHFRFFNATMARRAHINREMAARLAATLRADSLRIVFQPQVDVDTGEIHAVEALLRYPGHAVGWRRPLRMIELAERGRFLPELLRWVLHRTMQAARDLPSSPPVAINICSPQLSTPDLDEWIRNAAEQTQFPLARLQVHLPLSGVMDQIDQAIVQVERLRRLGVKTYLDNFGNTHFSIVALESLAPDGVCIDRSIVTNMRQTPERCLTLKALLAMLTAMQLPIVVQGVTNSDQLDWLRRMAGGLAVQGEQVTMPLEPAELHTWLQRQTKKT